MDVSQHLDRPSGRLSYDLSDTTGGTGPLVVASPGLGDLRSTYRLLTPALAAAGHRVAAVDLRGHGGSSTGWDDHSETAVAGDLLALAERLGGGPAVVVGNSYSAGAAVVAAAQRPDLVRGLVLTGPFVRDLPLTAAQRFSTWVVARTPFGRALWDAYVPSLHAGRRAPDFAEHRRELSANLREPGRFTAVAAMARAGHAAAGAALPRVQAPALVVMGERDPDFPDPGAEARAIAGLLGGPAEVLMVPEAGHYPHVQRADLVTPAVLGFLAGLPAGR